MWIAATTYHRNRHAKLVCHHVAMYHEVCLQLHHYNDRWPTGTSFECRVSYFFLLNEKQKKNQQPKK